MHLKIINFVVAVVDKTKNIVPFSQIFKENPFADNSFLLFFFRSGLQSMRRVIDFVAIFNRKSFYGIGNPVYLLNILKYQVVFDSI